MNKESHHVPGAGLDRRPPAHFPIKALLAALLSVLFFVFTYFAAPKAGVEAGSLLLTSVLFAALYLAALLIIAAQKWFDPVTLLATAAATAALIFVRICLLPHVSLDMSFFLLNWVKKMQNCAGFTALKAEIGDYNMPYMYIIFLISRLRTDSVLLIKYISCVSDVFLAYSVMKLASLKTGSPLRQALAFIGTLAIPTVFLNSAMWGQCDTVYAAFCLASLYCALKGRGALSCALYGFAFSFKLQAIFLFPALVVCLFLKKLRLRDSLWGIGVFVLTLVPALLAGRSIVKTLSIYVTQMGLYKEMTKNAPSVWQLLGGDYSFDSFNLLAVMLCGAAVVTLLLIVWQNRQFLDRSGLITVFLLFALMIPFLLPQMHERYFFLADVLSLLIIFYRPRLWYVPILVIFASYTGYIKYLTEFDVLSLKYAAMLLLGVLVCLFYDFYRQLSDVKARLASDSLLLREE